MRILVINPGSTSTKIGVFEEETSVFDKTLRHQMEELQPFEKISDQYDFRKKVIMDNLNEAGYKPEDFDGVVGMGGLVKSIPGGTYTVNEAMITDLQNGIQGDHASNLGGLISYEIAKSINKPAFIVDPVVVDEYEDIARISGHPAVERISIFHALNQKAMARRYCKEVGKTYEDVNLIIAHMGGGISVGCHNKGRVIDSNNALDGDGPFTPERSGGLPAGQLAKLCFSGEYTHAEVKKMITGKGGIVAYFNTNNMMEIEEMAKNDPKVKLHIDAMAYQIAKEIAAQASVVSGEVDAVILTGGLAYWKYFLEELTKRVKFIAPVTAYPGEHELMALAQGALRVLKGEEDAKIYI